MGVVNTKTTTVTNLDATPPVMAAVTDTGGVRRSIVESIEAASGDSSTSTYRIARVHSSWRIVAIHLKCDALGGSCAADIGLYQTAANGGAVAAVGAYATAQTLVSAITTAELNLAYEARDVAYIKRRVWQDAGASADTYRWYDLALTLTADTASAGTISLEVVYVAD